MGYNIAGHSIIGDTVRTKGMQQMYRHPMS
jgi:hypothetical protein